MDDVTRNRIAAFDRCEQWFHYNAAGVNTIGKLKNLALEFKTKLSTLQNTTGAHSGAVSESQEQADAFEAGAPSPRRQTRTHRRLHHRKRLRIRRRGTGILEIRQPRRGSTKEKGTTKAISLRDRL